MARVCVFNAEKEGERHRERDRERESERESEREREGERERESKETERACFMSSLHTSFLLSKSVLKDSLY